MEITTPWEIQACRVPEVASVVNKYGHVIAAALPLAEAEMMVASKALLDACLSFQHARQDCRDKGIGPDPEKLNEILDVAVAKAID